eukprot:TRINITY_DN7419_c0_g2_i2.p1 TRINITY_DN7419_c0_g2~~TRINITY_DN7419_c0_g2_i2.p1  ORF type:complete len:353 (+),score=69.61 TRINITY_DN7419_c0_g2_i2:107-1165(+)
MSLKFDLNCFFVILLSLAGYFVTLKLIPVVKNYCARKGLHGFDINKGGTEKIPEALGIVPATVFLICVILCYPVFTARLGQGAQLAEYNAASTSILLMLFLGFADDVLDVRWSVKIFLSFLATIPLLVVYSGPTVIVCPKPLQPWIPKHIPLGILYHVYMALIAVFSTNSINIYAGVNGLETGQSFVIAIFILIHNYLQLEHPLPSDLVTIFIMLPYLFTLLPLLYFNWYPSSVFVGDSFTYYSGMTFAVVGVLGHFSKTLMLFFIPQLLNFLISVPQLLKIIPCPRHRLPSYNKKTGKLECVTTHWNLINLALYILGPTSERMLTIYLCIFQVLCCCFGLFIRHYLSTFVY